MGFMVKISSPCWCLRYIPLRKKPTCVLQLKSKMRNISLQDLGQELYNTQLITCLYMDVRNLEPKKNLSTFTRAKKLKEVQSYMDGQKMLLTLNYPMALDLGLEKNPRSNTWSFKCTTPIWTKYPRKVIVQEFSFTILATLNPKQLVFCYSALLDLPQSIQPHTLKPLAK